MKRFLILPFFFFTSNLFSQEFYEFGEKSANKGKWYITPGVGVTIKDGGGAGLTGSAKVGYFLSRYLSIGVGYFYVTTNKDYANYIGSTPNHSINFLVGGEFFQIGKKIGFHGTGGIGYGFGEGGMSYGLGGSSGSITTYLDAGVSFKVSESFLIQPQIMFFDWRPGTSIGLNFKL